jgi:hypothetical protein
VSVHPTTAETISSSPPNIGTPVGTPPRKSRFVIEESNADTYQSSPSVRSSSPMLPEVEDHHTAGSSNVSESGGNGEVMKGRFYVNQAVNKPVTFSDTPIIHHQHYHSDTEAEQHPLHKVPSHDMLSVASFSAGGDINKKSRFEIYQPIPLSRDNSSTSSSSAAIPTNGINKTTTAVVEKKPPMQIDLTTENIALLTESSRKIGRFELTGGSTTSSADVTPRGSISSGPISHNHHDTPGHHHSSHLSIDSTHSLVSSPQYQIEELFRFNEQQRIMLQELSLAIKNGSGGGEYHYFEHHGRTNSSTR